MEGHEYLQFPEDGYYISKETYCDNAPNRKGKGYSTFSAAAALRHITVKCFEIIKIS